MLLGPVDGGQLGFLGADFGCELSENAVVYELLMGPSVVELEPVAPATATPPLVHVAQLPFEPTYWTVRVSDAFGSTIMAHPRVVASRMTAAPRRASHRVAP